MRANNIQSMGDMVHAMNELVDTVNKFISDYGYDKRLAEILQVSIDPDEIFLVDQIMKIIAGVENMAITLKYLELPIKVEGKLRVVGEGMFFLDQMPVKDGEKLEILIQDRWCLATVVHDPRKASGSMLIDTNEKVVDLSAVNGARARMRG